MFVFRVMRAETLGIVVFFFGVSIFLPLMLWEASRHFRKGGEFRSWLSTDHIGQEVPFDDMGKSFEIPLDTISNLREVHPASSDGSIRYYLTTKDGKSFEMCRFYGNPVDRYFSAIQELRPEVEFLEEGD
ncbi:MAG: hypothetical protein AAGF67_07665 [Verrucomicrobiota bacterium]